MAQIAWSEPALADLEAIAEYIALENPDAASELVHRVVARVGQLAQHPQSGRRVPELGNSRYRELIEPPCRVFYRFDGQRALIVHIMRTERLLRPGRLQKKA